ncbi:MAG: hypothetical protein IT317_17215 [Anaerolineales bacterium]|nr:hypothetical protein [Anaerolineales bacterium]
MKTLAAALAAAQRTGAGRPFARASLADNGRLHPALLFTHTYSGAGVRAVNCGSFFFRTRQTSGPNTVDIQKVTDPTVSSQWTTWTNLLAGGVPQAVMHAVLWTGTYVVLVYQSSADGKIYSRRSTDGVTFSAAAVSYADPAPAHLASLGGVSGGASNSGLAVYYNGHIYFGAYNAAADTWSALEDTGLATSAATAPTLAGFYDAARARHVLLAATVQAVAWARYAVFALARTAPGVFGAPVPYLHANRGVYAYLAVSAEALNGYWWLVVGRARPGTSSSTYYLAASDDGLHWEDGYPLGGPIAGWLEPLGALTGDPAQLYLANEAQVLRSTAPAYWSGLTVARAALTAGAGDGTGITALVDNRAGAATEPALNSVFTLERGYTVDGVDYAVAAGTFWVTGYRYLGRGALLEVTAVDAAGRLAGWTADQSFALRGARVDTLVEHLCALAGAHAVSFDASPLWAVTVANFTLAGGGSALAALRALQARVPFEWTAQADGSLYCWLPAASPTAAATFGAADGEHALWPGEFGASAAVNFVSVAGAPPATVGSDAYAAAEVLAAGRRWVALSAQPRLTLNADADALAAALLIGAREQARAGAFDCPPHLGLEPGDVIEVNDGTYAAEAGPWRVARVEEHYGARGTRPFYQRVTLRGTT